MSDHKALFWEYDPSINRIQCKLCPQFCVISDGKQGICHTRENRNNKLYAINYKEVTSIAIDPIEKKPLYHFKPGSQILSLGTFGCNMRCSFCQNYTISQERPESRNVSVNELVDVIDQRDDTIGVAFTYNEPFMWYEYVFDTVKKLKEKRKEIRTVLVTNGYVNEEPLKQILPYIDAMNIDLKAFTESYYKKICGAKLEPVLKTIELANKETHVEVTTLMVTGENDSLDEIKSISKFIHGVNPNIPLHLSRYFPNYQMENEATDVNQIKQAQELARKYQNYVYVGNVNGVDHNTYCPNCDALLIERSYHMKINLNEPKCPKCGKEIYIRL